MGQAGKVVVYADMHCHIMAGTKLARYHDLTSASLDCQLHKALSPGQVHLLTLRVLRQEDACMQLRDSAYHLHTVTAHYVTVWQTLKSCCSFALPSQERVACVGMLLAAMMCRQLTLDSLRDHT